MTSGSTSTHHGAAPPRTGPRNALTADSCASPNLKSVRRARMGQPEEASGSEPASLWAGRPERLGRAPAVVVGQGVWLAVA